MVTSIAVDEMPATTRKELVSPRDGCLPMLLSVEIIVDVFTVLEPVDRAADGAQAEEKVGGHGRWWRRLFETEVEVCQMTKHKTEDENRIWVRKQR